MRGVERADIVLVAVRDEQLDAALAELGGVELAPGAVVLHANGGLDPQNALEPLRAAGHPAGTFHPLVPLAEPTRARAILNGAWVGIEGDPEAVRVATFLADRIGAHVIAIPPAARGAYHAAAVMASNFPTVLAALAVQLLERSGVGPYAARDVVRHLIAGAASNIETAEPGEALTGPVSRGDADTVARHIEALRDDAPALAVYAAVSRAALSLAADQGTDPARLRRVAAALDVSASR